MKINTRSSKLTMAAAVLCLLGLTLGSSDQPVNAKANTVKAPIFEVDPLWPKAMPNHWLLGMAIGIWDRPRKWAP